MWFRSCARTLPQHRDHTPTAFQLTCCFAQQPFRRRHGFIHLSRPRPVSLGPRAAGWARAYIARGGRGRREY